VSEAVRTRWLKIVLRVWGCVSILIFGTIFIGYAIQTPAFRQGGALASLVWDDLPGHVALMISGIYLTWAVFLLIASAHPAKYTSFLAFTMWANLVHSLIMIPGALEHQYHSKFATDIPWILLLSVAIFVLRPRDTEITSFAPQPAVNPSEVTR
jgi:hypothetical protein